MFDLITNNILSNPLTGEISLSELIGLSDEQIREVARATAGQFIKDRQSLSAGEFISKYFPDAQIRQYDEIANSRRPSAVRARKARTANGKKELVQAHGNYVIALYEMGDDFAVTFRKLDNAHVFFDFESKNVMVYKRDGKKYHVVSSHTSRVDAIRAKRKLVEEMVNRGKTELVGILPV